MCIYEIDKEAGYMKDSIVLILLCGALLLFIAYDFLTFVK
jgi:hypothetical protein